MNKCLLKKIIKHNKKLLISSILFSKLLLNYIKFQYELISHIFFFILLIVIIKSSIIQNSMFYFIFIFLNKI